MKVLIICFLLISTNIFCQTPYTSPNEWEISWQDDFDYYNQNKWLINHLAIHGDEPQIYLKDNVSFENGKLIISVKQENYTCPQNPQSEHAWATGVCKSNTVYKYTSGWIESKNSNNTAYGYIEAKIKYPCEKGYWPAFWTYQKLGNSSSSTASEIDIAEMFGHKGKFKVGNFIHTHYDHETPKEFDCAAHGQFTSTNCKSYDNQFRNYAVLWTPFNISWYYENNLVYQIPNQGIHDPVRIILNFALGRMSTDNEVSHSATYPNKMEIDFIKLRKVKEPQTVT